MVRTVLLPLLEETAEACGGFDWSDEAFERVYARLEASLFGTRRAYGAVAPVVGLSTGGLQDLGAGLRIRHVATGELAAHWPAARGLLPEGFEREPDRLCVLELEQSLSADDGGPPDAPGELADAVTALRLASAGPIAAGPVLFERLDWRPYGIRPVLPVAATAPPGEPVRIDPVTAARAKRLRERLTLADEDRDLGEALDRWELSLFQSDPFASEQLRGSLSAALGAGEGLFAASLRAAALLGETPRERAEVLDRLRLLARGDAAVGDGRPRPTNACPGARGRRPGEARDRTRRVPSRAPPEAGGTAGAGLRGRLTLGPVPLQTRDAEPDSVGGMEEARRVLERLARIEQLEREHAPAGELLDQLRELVQEAETWLRAEPEPAGAVAALARCRSALAVEEREEVMLLAR